MSEAEKNLKPDSGNDKQGGVKFAQGVEEIVPGVSDNPKDVIMAQEEADNEEMTPEAREEIRRLAMAQQKSRLQEHRAANFSFVLRDRTKQRLHTVESRVNKLDNYC